MSIIENDLPFSSTASSPYKYKKHQVICTSFRALAQPCRLSIRELMFETMIIQAPTANPFNLFLWNYSNAPGTPLGILIEPGATLYVGVDNTLWNTAEALSAMVNRPNPYSRMGLDAADFAITCTNAGATCDFDCMFFLGPQQG